MADAGRGGERQSGEADGHDEAAQQHLRDPQRQHGPRAGAVLAQAGQAARQRRGAQRARPAGGPRRHSARRHPPAGPPDRPPAPRAADGRASWSRRCPGRPARLRPAGGDGRAKRRRRHRLLLSRRQSGGGPGERDARLGSRSRALRPAPLPRREAGGRRRGRAAGGQWRGGLRRERRRREARPRGAPAGTGGPAAVRAAPGARSGGSTSGRV